MPIAKQPKTLADRNCHMFFEYNNTMECMNGYLVKSDGTNGIIKAFLYNTKEECETAATVWANSNPRQLKNAGRGKSYQSTVAPEKPQVILETPLPSLGGVRNQPAIEMRPLYVIVIHADNNGSATLEDYVNEETALEAFESIRKNGYHIPEGEFGDLNEKITFEQYGRVDFTMDIELWDNYNNHHGFEAIEHTPIVMIDGAVQNSNVIEAHQPLFSQEGEQNTNIVKP
jgi:uncharacterized protein YegP (UPF0339 family)